ncbi:LAME_0B04104g1_1 [Lachancea meyersii CBS 8951]|uniref:LAME_0B04104g1_1 n=1 Tax=Lachancea meyersii CBS 8951 TaxID=1266667 RepID=A0A1G4IUH5_9SACH|nr:LAME_0B04104g1_1 [Lachancea meyersii CBS 8951]
MGLSIKILYDAAVESSSPKNDGENSKLEPARPDDCSTLVPFPRGWRLHQIEEVQDEAHTGKRTNKRSDGVFWCSWFETGADVIIMNESGDILNLADLSSPVVYNVISMDVVDRNIVAFGSREGYSGTFNLANGLVELSSTQLLKPVTNVWTRRVGRSRKMVVFSRFDCSISVTSLSTGSNTAMSLRLSSQFRCVSADVDHKVETVAMHDGKVLYLWSLRWPNSPDGVRGLYLEEGEEIVSLKFASTKLLLLIATSRRLFIYDFASNADLVCNIREDAFYDFFENDSKIVVEQTHLYGTHIACFGLDNTTARWAPLGYSDIRAQFGIRDIRKFYALRSRLLLFMGHHTRFQLETATDA